MVVELDRKQDLNVLYTVCVFRADRKTRWPPWPLAETFSTSPLKPLNRIQRNMTGRKISTPSTKFVFFGSIEKQDVRPGLWLAETFSTSPLKALSEIQRNLTGSKISTSSTKFVFFGQIAKTRWPPQTLIGWDIFDFFSETTERNSTNFDRKQDLNALYPVCIFRAYRKNKMAALAFNWLRHFSTFPLKTLNGIQQNLTGSKISRPLPSLWFLDQKVNKNGHPGQSVKKVAIVLRCTLCGPLGFLLEFCVGVRAFVINWVRSPPFLFNHFGDCHCWLKVGPLDS